VSNRVAAAACPARCHRLPDPKVWVSIKLGDQLVTTGSGHPSVVYALRYAVTTEAGSLPRSLTERPFWRAQERISAWLGEPADGEVSPFDCAVSALVGATDRAFLAAAGFLLAVVLLLASLLAFLLAGFLGSCSSLETTSVTPYNAPTTRIAS
jgi:hypothetical protein